MILALDPGADLGWALFYASKKLIAAGVGEVSLKSSMRMCTAFERVVCERPMIYPDGRQKARPRDVLTLAIRAGEVAGWYARSNNVRPEYFEPDEWKGGSISKAAHHPRIWARLSDTEQAIVSHSAASMAKGKQHNMLDAIGIGLFAIGRASR